MKDEEIQYLQREMKKRIRPIAYEYMTRGLSLNHIRQVFRNLLVVLEDIDTRLELPKREALKEKDDNSWHTSGPWRDREKIGDSYTFFSPRTLGTPTMVVFRVRI